MKKQLKFLLKGGNTNRMDNHKGPFSSFKKFLSNKDKNDKKVGKYQYMILVLCIGAAFMLVGNIFFNKPSITDSPASVQSVQSSSSDAPVFGMKKNSNNNVISDYEREYETQLKEALDEMLGVKDVRVVVTIDATEENIFEKNKVSKNQTTDETDPNGGKRNVQESSIDEQMVIVRSGEKEVPIVVQKKKPKIRGVLIVAKGAENIQVKKWIVEAVTRALGVPSYRVAVMPKK